MGMRVMGEGEYHLAIQVCSQNTVKVIPSNISILIGGLSPRSVSFTQILMYLWDELPNIFLRFDVHDISFLGDFLKSNGTFTQRRQRILDYN